MKAKTYFHHGGTEIAEIGKFANKKILTPRLEPILSDVEGRLRGAKPR